MQKPHPPSLPAGPFTWAMAHGCGCKRYQLDALVKNASVRKLLHNVYVSTAFPVTDETRARALRLVTRPGVIICDRSASWLYGLDTFEFRELEIPPPIETCVLPDRTRVRRPECIGRSRDLGPSDVQTIEGILVTTPLRTALDLGCQLRRRDALAALDGFMRRFGMTKAQLMGELARFRGRRGVVQLRQLIPLADARSESPGESWVRMAILDAELPMPQLQYEVTFEGRTIFRLDLAYPKSKVAIEYDGQQFHDTPEQRRADQLRRDWLRRRGWTVIVITQDMLTNDAVMAWTQEISDALRLTR